ncbi:phytanoyl-CoA dioxygenase family protein [Pseudovibrio exalbescens]|uniref:phytanoyl-CoA dioxygenase family protein n=1 Tax=Pseudovibrio exalbescens TaxID=197461 RepID=UPI00236525A0|nr:phytanoyl-CoA dioxygenase family protein [Pseudovibrio exalbescens]MDD7909197.1 phytanoyl-CoA dioxygenase family protein [Pseudovibrio exalbescens]
MEELSNSAARHLDALGATLPVSGKMREDLDQKGFTIIENVVDADWLEDMRRTFDSLVAREGENLAIEHHQEDGATRIANLVNKGTVWEKVWAHPLVLAACHHIFAGEFKISSLNAREALLGGGHQPLHADWKKPRPDFPKVHLVNSIWAIDDLSSENGAPRILPGTHLRPELPEDVLADVEAPHPDEVVFECPAGSVMIFNAHTWHGGTTNKTGARRRVLHGLYIDRQDTAQQEQQKWITAHTLSRLTPAQKWLLDVG